MPKEVKKNDNLNKEIGGPGGKKGKKGGTWAKYKWWIIAGGIIVVILIWYFWKNKSGSAGQGPGGQANNNIDPATGYTYGSPADVAALGGSGTQQPTPIQGQSGPTGATGSQGPPGAAGRPQSLRDIAIMILRARGIKDPTQAEIRNLINALEHIGGKGNPRPVGPHRMGGGGSGPPTRKTTGTPPNKRVNGKPLGARR